MTSTNETSADLLIPTSQLLPLGTYCFLVTLLGLSGNTLVLYSSLLYNSIKLDEISLIFVQHIALADMLYLLSAILPCTVTYFAKKYLLGDVYCFVFAQLALIPAASNILFVLVVTVYRCRLVTSPFFSVTRRLARVLVFIIWCLATVPTGISLGNGSDSVFTASAGRCISTIYLTTDKTAKISLFLGLGVIVILPLFVITVCNITLCVIAVRNSFRLSNPSRSINYRGLLTILSLSVTVTITWAPYVAYTFLKAKTPQLSQVFELVAFHCIFLNSCVNPYLYTLTNRRFGEFVKGLVFGAGSALRRRVGADKTSVHLSSAIAGQMSGNRVGPS